MKLKSNSKRAMTNHVSEDSLWGKASRWGFYVQIVVPIKSNRAVRSFLANG